MAAPKTVITIDLDGSNKDFEVPFEYLARKFVVVTLIGTDRRVLTLSTDYRFTQRTIITTTQSWGPADGYERIEIRRLTSATERLVDFSDGSVLRAYDLNISNVQSLHIAEEGRDIATDTIGVDNNGNLDARGRRIVNLADAVEPGDAVTLRQNQEWGASALNQADRATQQANIATQQAVLSTTARQQSENAQVSSQNARDASVAARDLSQQWAANPENVAVIGSLYSSLHYAAKASASQSSASQSMTRSEAARDRAETAASTATTQAGVATTQADRAKTEADKLANLNTFAETIDSVSGGVPRFKGAVQVGGTSGLILRKEDVTDPNTDRVVRLTHSADGGVRLTDDRLGRVRAIFAADGSAVLGNTVDSAGDVIARSGSIRSYATGPTANSSYWFQGADASNRAVMYAGPLGHIYLTPGYGLSGSAGTWTLNPTGEMVTPSGSSLRGDGNIISSIYAGGTLLDAVRPRQMTRVVLSTAAAVSGTILTLTDDVFNYIEFAGTSYSGGAPRASILNILALAAEPIGTQMYLPYIGNSYILAKFNDTVAGQRRVLHIIQFGSGIDGFTGLTAYRKA